MLTDLIIKNFQSIGNAHIELGKITVIIGPSFLGKSATIRAFRTLVRNKYESSFLKKGTSTSSIEVRDSDGKWAKYTRDGGPSYTFSENNEPFIKIGRDVPQPIKEWLNMDEIVFDSDLSIDFNIQQQFDRPFIISLSGFETAKVFGKMMNLELVMSASRNISKDIQNLNKEKDKQQAVIDLSIDYIQSNKSIELKYSLLQNALSLQEEAETEEEFVKTLFNLILQIEENNSDLTNLYKEDKIIKSIDLSTFDTVPEDLELLLVQDIEFNNIIDTYTEINNTLKDLDVPFFIKEVEDYSQIENILTNLLFEENKSTLLKSLNDTIILDNYSLEEFKALSTLIDSGNTINNNYSLYLKDSKTITDQAEVLSKEFESFIKENNICPVVNKPYTQECVSALKGDLKL